jgi:hypothetical protein
VARGNVFDFNTLSPNLKRLLPLVDAAVDIVFDAEAARAESMMRENAPWTDRTGNARAGLKAEHKAVPMVSHELILFHSMPYGIWLEVRWSGRYAIIGPTMITVGQDLASMVTAAVQHATQME